MDATSSCRRASALAVASVNPDVSTTVPVPTLASNDAAPDSQIEDKGATEQADDICCIGTKVPNFGTGIFKRRSSQMVVSCSGEGELGCAKAKQLKKAK